MQLLVLQFIIKKIHIGFMHMPCVTSQGIDYKLPEDDTIKSKHVEVW